MSNRVPLSLLSFGNVLAFASGCTGSPTSQDAVGPAPDISLEELTVGTPADLPPCNHGREGDVAYVASTRSLVACVSGGWKVITTPSGPQGPAGATGPQGPAGPSGPAGPAGSEGPAGMTGSQGPAGATGSEGPAGAAGSQGPAGATGSEGPAGATGSQGPAGAPGPSGAAGLTSRVRLTPITAGATCQYGGTEVAVGVDANSNGALDSDEVNQTAIVCSGTTIGGAHGATQADGNYFPAGSPWNTDVSNAALSPESSTIITWLDENGGWGTAQMLVDTSLSVVDVPAGTPKRAVEGLSLGFDSDHVSVPVPPGGLIEGRLEVSPLDPFSGYICPQGDCRMLFVSRSEHRAYELWHADLTNDHLTAGVLSVWDTSTIYGPSGRGEGCASADAAGLPIAPLLFSAEELKAGVIRHAVRFALPNVRIRAAGYVHPATHTTTATAGPISAPPYGVHFRLKSAFDVSGLDAAAQVVARAMQQYGMYLADQGEIPLMAQNDALGSVKWGDVGFDTHSLASLRVTDFEVLDFGATLPFTTTCIRTPLTE
jgi:hypothetical protein